MKIAKYTTNLYASEVYRELERQASKKGFFKPTEAEAIKVVANDIIQTSDINEPVELISSSGDFVQDVALLVYAMRRKGLINQASEIEDNLLMYKKAESSLYNLNIEQTKDIIDFAHRDGDVEIIEGSGDLGTIETPQSAAEKILSMIRKQPTGELPKNANNISELSKIIKQAQLPEQSSISELSSNEPKKEVTEMMKKKLLDIKSILSSLANNFTQVSELSFRDALKPDGTGTFLHGDGNGSSLFIALGGNYSILDHYGRMFKNAYRGGNPAVETITQNIISSGNPNRYLSSIGNYKIANNQSNKLKKSAQVVQFSAPPPATKEFIKSRAPALANQIFRDIYSYQTKSFEEMSKVNKALENQKIKILNIAARINKLAGSNIKTPKDYYTFAMAVKGAIPQIKQYLSWPIMIFKGLGKPEIANDLQSKINVLDVPTEGLLTEVKSIIDLTGVDKEFLGRVNDTLGRLISIRNALINAMKKYKTLNKHKDTVKEINSMISIIRARSNGGEEYLLEGLKSFGKYKTFDDLDEDTIKLHEFIKNEIARAVEGG